MPFQTSPSHQAAALVSRHGERARQVVVDEIVAAIRLQDLAAAKRWNAVGDAVDLELAKSG